MQDAGDPDPCAEALGICGEDHHRFWRCFKQMAVDRSFVPIGDAGYLSWHGEDNVEVFHGQQIFGTRSHPITSRRALALRAMPVFTRVIGDVLMAAFCAGGHMPAKRFSSAGFNCRHHFQLA